MSEKDRQKKDVDMSEAKTTIDHAQIKQWVEERGGHPARVKGTDEKGTSGVLVIDYPGYKGTATLETISWDEFFQGFEENNLAFLYQDETKAGAAIISPSDGPSRAERSYTPVKIGATQQEHSISGAPASPAVACERSDRLPSKRAKTLQFIASGATFTLGQNFPPGDPWPRVTLQHYTALINYETGSMRQELLREMGGTMPWWRRSLYG